MTKRGLEVVLTPARVERGRMRRSARVECPSLGTHELWYEVDEAHAHLTTDRADPFVVATLLLGMSQGWDLTVSGARVDAGLLHHLVEFQRIWNAWFGLDVVEIHAEADPPTSAPSSAVVAFSGGADSAFSAWWHTRGDGGDVLPLRSAMMLHGLDVPLSNPTAFTRAAARSKRMVDSLGLQFVVVATNAWELPVPVDLYTGVGVAAGLHLLGGGHGAGLVPSTATYRDLVVPLTSSPVSDWLLGGSVFAILHDGARYNRLEKLRFLTGWAEALENLRVCLVHPGHDRNCGRCNKCMLTLAAFRVIGVEPAAFDRMPPATELERWARRLPRTNYYLQEGTFLVQAADEQGIDEPWVRAMRSRIRMARVKQAVRAGFPGFADRIAALHRHLHALRGALPSSTRRR